MLEGPLEGLLERLGWLHRVRERLVFASAASVPRIAQRVRRTPSADSIPDSAQCACMNTKASASSVVTVRHARCIEWLSRGQHIGGTQEDGENATWETSSAIL
eukprot:35563-Rhodomonas_salina.1